MMVPDLGSRSITFEAVADVERPVGQLLLGFALLDHQLDFWLMAIFDVARKHNLASKMPHLVGDKIGLLVKCFTHLAEYSKHQHQALMLLKQADELNSIRNTIVHGALSHFGADPEPMLIFARLRYSKGHGIHLLKDEGLTFAQINSAASRVNDVVAEMHAISQDLHRQ
ncbi:hypothetical protein [Mesorhizobium mediterraneum]|uniref:hypothetical protein n=1 Tax=Mesorhizobium mediterraneum TaxID=43617 RepID=UPI00177AE477|nr:hypothetical protein [Mesorhizobium mediterraneum]